MVNFVMLWVGEMMMVWSGTVPPRIYISVLNRGKEDGKSPSKKVSQFVWWVRGKIRKVICDSGSGDGMENREREVEQKK